MNYAAVAGVSLRHFLILIFSTAGTQLLFSVLLTINYVSLFLQVIRSLLELCSTDADRLCTLQDAAALISAAPSPTTAGTAGYPPLEARYLITAAWNRGATHSKFARMKDAEAFMGVALHILGAFSSGNTPENQQEKSSEVGFTADEKVNLKNDIKNNVYLIPFIP
jgi:hypothetical protein